MKRFLIILSLFFISINFVSAQAPGIRWQRVFGTEYTDYLKQIAPTNDGGYIVAGFKDKGWDYDYYIVKLDAEGVMQWQKTFGGANDDYARSVQQTSDGGFIIAGNTQSFDGDVTNNHGHDDCWVIKLNANGELEWQKALGGSDVDGAKSIRQTKDGGYILAGFTASNDGDVSGNNGGIYDFWVTKLNAAGELEWQKCLGGSDIDEANSIQQTNDDGYIVTGYTESNDGDVRGNHGYGDYWVVKLSATGKIDWQKCFGGSFNEEAESIQQTRDGGYIVAGSSGSYDGDVTGNHKQWGVYNDYWIIKLSGQGELEWEKCFGGGGDDISKRVQQTNDNGYVVAGYTSSNDGDVTDNHGNWDYWIVKLNAQGDLQWQKCLGGSDNDWTESIIQTQDGNYVVAGYSLSRDGDVIENLGSWDFWIVKLGEVSTINAFAFLDKNLDGVKNNNESLFANGVLKVERLNDSFNLITDGHYKIDCDTGSSILSYFAQSNYYVTQPSEHASYFSDYNQNDTVYFAVQPIANQNDVQVSLFAISEARPGFDVVYKITYENVGTTDFPNGTIQLIKDKRLNLISSTPDYVSAAGDTIKWNYTNLNAGDTGSVIINFRLVVPPAVNAGDTLFSCVHMNIDEDLTPRNNRDTLNQIVIASLDPNDKSENHAGSISKSNIISGDYLTYTIRFQNTGTDTAFNIIIRDTLSNKLDWSTLQMVDASDDYQLNIKNGNKCVWYFNNILLPDSNVNEPASHGYIVYRIKPKSTLVSGDVINNSAGIYFDYNLPVQTNIAKTVVSDVTLPLHLLSFSAQRNGKTNLLKWSSTNEINTDRFEIQRSSNGKDFTTIGSVKSYNNGKGKNDYSFTDAQPLKAVNYYRLKMVDKDGKYTFSAIRSINNTNSFDVAVYPNPVKNNLTLNFSSEKAIDVQIEIVSTEGKLVLSKKIHIAQGESKQTINTASLNAGNYFLKCSSGEGEVALRFVKQ